MSAPDVSSDRRWDIDWLRTLVVLLLVPYHTARLFDTVDPFYVKNDELSEALSNWVIPLGAAVGMQLLFLLSGAATWFGLVRRGARTYAKERLLRLLVPFLFGVLVLVPPQTYLGLRTHSDYSGTFPSYYPSFFEFHAEDVEGYTQGGLTPAHLWFILFLFLFSMLALPAFLWLRKGRGRRTTAYLARLLSRPGMILAVAIPLVVLERLLATFEDPLLMFAYFLAFFVIGYLLMSDRRIDEAVDRHKRIALILGPVVWVVLKALPAGSGPDWAQQIIADVYEFGLFTWFTIIALLGYGRRFFRGPNRFLGYFGETAYPFYILHQTVLVLIGFSVVQWNAGIPMKYLTVAATTYLATTLTYEVAVRRTGITRFLFGMRGRDPAARTARDWVSGRAAAGPDLRAGRPR